MAEVICPAAASFVLATPASLRVPGADSDDETKTPSPSPHHGRSRPPSLIADSSSESDEGDARGEVRTMEMINLVHFAKQTKKVCFVICTIPIPIMIV